MPDGDRVHKGLAWKYQKAYKQICDGQFGSDDLAHEVVSAVWKDIQKGGDVLLQLLKHISEQCQQILDRRMFDILIDWQKEQAQVDAFAQPLHANCRLKALAVEACKEQLNDLRYGVNPSNCYIELLKKYTWNVYVAQFEERIPLNPVHYQNVSREFIREKLHSMRVPVQDRLSKYVEQAYRQETVQLARTPRQKSSRKQIYTVDTDLSMVGA